MIEKKVRPVLPVYLFAVSWVVCGLVLPLYTLWGLVTTLAISMAVYLAATAFMPPKTILVPAPLKPFDTGEEQLDQALEQARSQLKELTALNARIPGQSISAQISRMERAGGAILDEVAKQPAKARQIRRFLHYYLPTAVKVISSYAHMAETGAAGQNAQTLKSDVEQNAQTIAAAFEKQLDSLFASEMLDITSDLDVLEHMMKGDGLAEDAPGGKDEEPWMKKITPKLDLAAEWKDTPAPSLTLEPLAPEPAKQPEAVQPAGLDESSLTPEEAKTVAEFAQKIDITDSAVVLQYGSASQKKVADFSGSALEQVRTKDLGEVGNMITDLIGQLKGFDATAEKPKGIMGLFKKAESQIEELKSKYSKAETNVNRIEAMLESHQVQLMKDMSMLDKMYDMNLVYFKELSMYILAGKQKLEQVRANELPALTAKARASGLPEDAQAANDLENMCIRFEKKLYDLELTRNISIQMAPQIRLVQNNDAMMAEKIQSSIVNTIPLWKSQMVLALGMANSQQAMEAQRAVTDMTNELLRKNAETLKMGTIAAAKESERGIVDIETLQQTNRNLIETLDEVARIQQEGREKRQAAQQELGRIEGELKAKLLELRN